MNGFDDNDNTNVNDGVDTSDDSAERDAQKARLSHEKRRKHILGIALSGLFIALMIISAFISIPIGPVKITLQFLVTNICCLMLGKKWGGISILLYLMLGLFGLPIFSNGGGFAYVLVPSFGFLIGMALGGFCAAWFREKVGKTNFSTYLLASLLDMVIMDIIGVAYGAAIMYGYMHLTTAVWNFFMIMLIPFIPIDIIKCVICALVCTQTKQIQ